MESLSADLVGKIRDWCATWKDLGLLSSVRIRYSPRLRRLLGYASVQKGADTRKTYLVTLAEGLRGGNRALFLKVLCHELAHVACWRKSVHTGVATRPHGSEWRQLVLQVGYTPSLNMCGVKHSSYRRSTDLRDVPVVILRAFKHTCPVCQMVRSAKKAVPQWRCASCAAAGLEGHLDITRDTEEK